VSLAPLASVSTVDERSPRPLAPSPDRSAHPAGSDLSDAEPIRPASISFEALKRIAAGLARAQQSVPLDGASDVPRSLRLLATAFYDVWLITWPDGSGLEPHDHGHVRSVLHVVEGELIEVFSDRVKRVDPAVRILQSGSSTPAESSVVHALNNRSGAEATTLHVYSPPLVDVTFFDLHSTGDCEALRSTAVVERAAQASSKEMAPSGPAPLFLVKS
jgi:hypothetical protein